MSGIAPTIPAPQLDTRASQLEAGKPEAAEAADRRLGDRAAEPSDSGSAAKTQVRLDASAGRFVHIVTDGETGEVLRSYPNEAQLAYSRAVMAYLRALQNAQK